MKDITPEIEAIASGYEYHKPPDFLVRLGDLLAQLYQWLVTLLQSLRVPVHGALDSRSMSSLMQIIIFMAGACSLAAVFWLMWRRALANRVNSDTGRGRASVVEKILDAAGLQAEAAELAQRGEFRSACRSIYLALLQLFHENGIAAFAPAKTNYEYRYLLAKHPQLKQRFKEMADRVEPIWFGNINAGREDYETCLSILSSAEREVSQSTSNT